MMPQGDGWLEGAESLLILILDRLERVKASFTFALKKSLPRPLFLDRKMIGVKF
jgi:hypothetical protein